MMTTPTRLVTAYTEAELARVLGGGRPATGRAHTFMRWLYRGPGLDLPAALPAALPDLSPRGLDLLRAQAALPRVTIKSQERSEDGTTKLLLDISDTPLETVVIPTLRRTTVCVSSQSGCARGCTFCATAKMGLLRNLDAGEIVAQVMLAARLAPAGAPLRNVVFMGMGEPTDNLDEVLKAIEVLSEPGGLGLAPRHMTVSSVGVLPKMEELLRRSTARLAISLNATTDEQRAAVMPVNRRWPLEEVLAFIREHATVERPILVEYILLGGVNDSDDDAARLASQMAGLAVRVNLIPVNPHPGSPFRRPTGDRVFTFHAALMDRGVRVYVRTTRGDEIRAACGQLHRPEASSNRRMSL